MSLEERLASNKLDEDAPDRPKVARVVPTEGEDNLGSAVMPSRDDCCVVVAFECCAAEVDELDAGVVEQLSRFGTLRERTGEWEGKER